MSKWHVQACTAAVALAITSCQESGVGFPPLLKAGAMASAVTVQHIEDFEDDSGSGAGGFADSVFIHTVSTTMVVDEASWTPVAPFPSPTHALFLPEISIDTVTFSLNSGEVVDHAGVWGNTFYGDAFVDFYGTQDELWFVLPSGQAGWQFVEAASTDVGIHGQPLGEIVAVALTGYEGMFDDLTIDLAAAVDLDIARFQVSKHFSLAHGQAAIKIKLVVKNNGTVDQPRDATVVGQQGGVQIYNQTMAVSDPPGGGRTAWVFPPFTPAVPEGIVWTATIADDDPDIDHESATTKVVP